MNNTGPIGVTDFNLNDLVVVDSPYSFYHGLTAKIVDLGPHGAMLTFTEQECGKVPDPRRVIPDRPTPFDYGRFVRPGKPLRQREREKIASNPEPCKKPTPVFLAQNLTQADPTPLKSSSKPAEMKSPESAGQVSLFD